MKAGFALWVCAGVLALAWPALAQPTAAPKVAAVDPATLRGLASARDYAPPPGIGFRAADFLSENVRLTAQWVYAAGSEGRKLPPGLMGPGWGEAAGRRRPD